MKRFEEMSEKTDEQSRWNIQFGVKNLKSNGS